MSNKPIAIIITLLVIFITSSGYGAAEIRKDNAEAVKEYKYTVDIGEFTKLRVLDDVNVIYKCNSDSAGMASFAGAEEFADAFIFTLKDNTLKVQVTTDDVGKPGLPTVTVYSNFLTYVENSSNFSVAVKSINPCPEFKVMQIGNGTIDVSDLHVTSLTALLNTGNGSIFLSGVCRDATYKMVGVGSIQADALKAKNVSCRIAGSGTIGCWPTQSLNVRGIGSTKIYYKGHPEISKKGGGKLFALPESESSADE